MKRIWRPWMGSVASAGLLSLAFAGLWPLVFIALAPWLASLRDTTPRESWRRGYGFGLLFSLTQLWWLGDLAYKWTHNAFLGVVPWLLASLLTAVYYGLMAQLIRSCYLLQALWAIPLAWAGMEVFRSYIPVLAFPWALLAEPLMAWPMLAGGAWVGTIVLVSALVVVANQIALGAIERRGTNWVRPAMLLGAVFLVGSLRFEGAKGFANVAAGQPGIDMAFDPNADLLLGQAVDSVIRHARGADLLVLPEGITRGGASIPPATNFTVQTAPPIVFGGQRGMGPVYQSAFSHDQGKWSFADKTRLVIFGEFVPGRSYLPFLSAFELPSGDLSAGDHLSTLRAGGFTVGPLICFEALFPDLGWRQSRAGAEILAVMSIDDWFAVSARERLARASQWRAIEAGRPLIRSGSLGRSMIVSASGEILAEAPLGERTVVTAEIKRGHGPFALAWLFPAISLGSLVAIPAFAERRRRMNSAVLMASQSSHEQTSPGRPD